jgi:hypothetical protein
LLLATEPKRVTMPLAGNDVTEAEIEVKVLYLVGIWVEALLYGTLLHHELYLSSRVVTGLYLFLFCAALPVFFRNNNCKNFSTTVFVMGNIFMFFLISMHSGQLRLHYPLQNGMSN